MPWALAEYSVRWIWVASEAVVRRLALLRLPVLHHHGNAGRAAAVFFLLHERNIQPDAGKVRGQQHAADARATRRRS